MDSLHHLFYGHHNLVLKVSALLRKRLVFKLDGSHTGSFVETNRATDVVDTAVSRVAVGYNRYIDRLTDEISNVCHLGLGDHSEVRYTQQRVCHPCPTQVHGLEICLLDQLGE